MNTEPTLNTGNDAFVPQESYPRLFLRFLRFGLLAWGGSVAQIAMIRQELVDEEHWIPSERFNRVLAVYQVLPGPEAHELCVYFGMLARGRIGAILAGLGFMLPGFVLMFGLSWLYVNYAVTTIGLFRTAVTDFPSLGIFIVALFALYRWKTKAVIPLVILGAGAVGLLFFCGESFLIAN